MTDITLLTALRAWANGTADALQDRASRARDNDEYEVAELAGLIETRCTVLIAILDGQISAEHRALLAAVAAAEQGVTLAGSQIEQAVRAVDRAAAIHGETGAVTRRLNTMLDQRQEAANQAEAALAAAKVALATWVARFKEVGSA